MKKSEKVVDYLIAGGEILAIPAGILAIIGVVFYVAGYKEIGRIISIVSLAICNVALLILIPSAIAVIVDLFRSEKEKRKTTAAKELLENIKQYERRDVEKRILIDQEVRMMLDVEINEKFMLIDKSGLFEDRVAYIDSSGLVKEQKGGLFSTAMFGGYKMDYKELYMLVSLNKYSIKKRS